MLVQGSPASSRKIRVSYPDETRKRTRSFTYENGPDERTRAFVHETDPNFADAAPGRRRKTRRWTLSKILIGYCPEFAASFAN